MTQSIAITRWPATARAGLAWMARLACLMLILVPGMANAQETLGVGDTVRVTVFQNPDLTTESRISTKGTIVMPLVGEVQLNGLNPTSAGTRIADQLKKGNFIKNPQVSVGVLQVRSRQVSVLGQVMRPGRYVLDDTGLKLTDVIALAGGIGPAGDDSVTVMLTREGKTTQRAIDIAKMYRTGDLSANFDVENGDTIYVQRAPLFYIYGEVQRAGAYRLEPNMSVMQALSLGGGVTPRGTDRGIKVHRRTEGDKFREVDAKLTDAIQADDVIYIKESLF